MMKKFSKKSIAGFTLLELLIASAIGTFLIAGVFTVFINGKESQSTIEVQTQLIDDGRFALRTLSYDLRHAGLWGKTNMSRMAGALGVSEDEAGYVDDWPAMPDIAGDCAAGWYRNFEESVFVSNNINPYVGTCIPNGEYRANTDVLVVKYAPPAPVADAALVDQVVYVYANNFQGQLFVGQTAPQWSRAVADLTPSNYTLRARAYFVNEFTEINGDGFPSLHRIALAPGPSLARTMMLPGVEDMQIQLGYDSTQDGSVNMYVDADNAVLDSGLRDVKAVQFWLMLRSRDRELVDGETQTLSVAGRPAITYNDGFRRVVISQVVRLQNRLNLSKAGS